MATKTTGATGKAGSTGKKKTAPIVAETTENAAVETVKRKRKNPLQGENSLILEPGDNTKFVRFNSEIAWLPDYNKHDPEQLKERISLYFNACAKHDVKPQAMSLCLALDIDDKRISEIINNAPSEHRLVKDMPPECRGVVRKAWKILHSLWSDYSGNGKMNPAIAIFMAKNWYGMKDVQDVVVAPSNPMGESASPEQLAEKYKHDMAEIIDVDPVDAEK